VEVVRGNRKNGKLPTENPDEPFLNHLLFPKLTASLSLRFHEEAHRKTPYIVDGITVKKLHISCQDGHPFPRVEKCRSVFQTVALAPSKTPSLQ
jgi:hypothetical protein